ncbi:hypothetical protein [uncultured Muribaculum sp.]|uniref:hypothetical protein n=3 Tax=uncultured Muribaculum sp. TaxID=1918613 RepID=UPI002601E32B|nr:hypothetical protein [uncultured Muribaculum sp.]
MNMLNKIIRIVTVLVMMLPAFSVLPAQAQSDIKDKIVISGKVYDRLTSHELPGAIVAMLRKDSSEIAQCKAYSKTMYGFERVEEHSNFYLPVPKVDGDYILKVTMDGYDPLYVDYQLKHLGRRERERTVNGLYLNRHTTRELGEITFTATKVKFYNRGDTLVYNADAFQLPEGSMLDALVKKLPGVEIRDNGQIYVNGKFVESLLLNGKDLFGSNRNLMLDNIGAYTVKTVEVYNKRGERSEFLDRDLPGDISYVMDVKLKKEYMAGTMINVEGGIGTSDRYLGRLFAMRYTNNSRITLYGNVNNLNDSRKPGETNNWTPDKMPSGVRTERNGGIDYRADNPLHTWDVSGNVQVSHTSANEEVTINRTNFLPGGNTYDYIYNTARNKSLALSTSHRFYVRNLKKTVQFSVSPYFNYRKNDDNGDNVAATFDTEQQSIDKSLIESVYENTTGSMRSAIINRSIDRARSNGTGYDTGLEFYSGVSIPGGPDYIEVHGEAQMTRRRLDRLSSLGIDYGDGPESTQSLNRKFRDRPARDMRVKGVLSYFYFPADGVTLQLDYGLEWKRSRKLSEMYRLEALGSVDGARDEEFESILDPANSYVSDARDMTHRIVPTFRLNKNTSAGRVWIQSRFPVSIIHRTLDYRRGYIDTTIVSNTATVSTDVMNTFVQWTLRNPAHVLFLSIDFKPELPSLVDMVDMRDDIDPLNIYEGNSRLKNAYNQKYGVSWSYNTMFGGSKRFNNSLSLYYMPVANALTRGYRYDSATGVRTYKTYNVSGNNSTEARHNFWLYFGNKGQFMVSNGITGTWGNVGDYIGEDSAPVRQSVKNFFLNDRLSMQWQMGQQVVWASVDLTRRNTTSSRVGFAPIHATNINYTLNGTFKLPYNFGLSTDLNLYTRRGYMDEVMNTTDFVWNAGLTYTAAKGALVFMLDGFDLLHQLNNVTYAVNAQGRTETYRNILPRYLLLHIQYRFNFKPRKAK